MPLSDFPERASDTLPEIESDFGENEGREERFPVVGVGASAGGLEAFTALLEHLPTDTGMAFVLVQHPDPRHEAVPSHLLSRATTMPVSEAADGAPLAPNRVYVIPPHFDMTVSGRVLRLTPRDRPGPQPIDTFLRSLASSRRNQAVAVILSGPGSDGALGVQAIREEGGLALAQDPQSAKFDGMPRGAISTGCVDFVLPPDRVAGELARIAREPRLINHSPAEEDTEFTGSEKDFADILDLLRASIRVDFDLHRQSTVRRRTLRRLVLLGLQSPADYVRRLKGHPEELHALAQDVLRRVARFFRDPAVFDVLSRRVFPCLIRRAPPGQGVRVWVPGCSTGEEAYSLAICFAEVAERMECRVPLQVFATDMNEAAIERARRGVYIENIAADVSVERLARFFVRTGTEFQVAKPLRELCTFSRHDLLRDPPFSKMDLVSCRNVLTYLDLPHAGWLSLFHFALNRGGFLLMGNSQTASSSPELFARLDQTAGLYVRKAEAPARPHAVPSAAPAHHPRWESAAAHQRSQGRMELRNEADRIVVERYGPPRAILNENLEVLACGGETAPYLAPAHGLRNRSILEVAREGLAEALAKALQAVAEKRESVRIERVEVREGDGPREVGLEVSPIGPEGRHFLVVFEEHPRPHPSHPEQGGAPVQQDLWRLERRVSRLQKELAARRAERESMMLAQEAADEEAVAANEELQSLNEELQSSKEELQAGNEELTCLNQQLQARNAELNDAREFAQATLDTARGSLVVLGPDLRVINANKSFYRLLGAPPEAVDRRFLYDLAEGQWSAPRLRHLLEEVLPKNSAMEDFEWVYFDPVTGRRILLLNARRFERAERILLAVEDITAIRRFEDELRQSQKMEAIGHLAAGVAHDFNNLLTGIVGRASLALDGLPRRDRRRSALEQVIRDGQKAADLTRQLLAYAGKGRAFLKRVDLSEVVAETRRLIQPSIPAQVKLDLELDKHLPPLLADPAQMQQVVMNLVINGFEAIGEAGGRVLVGTGRLTVTREQLPDLLANQKAEPGEYVYLEVRDTGSGMDEQTRSRIFDPFYTTRFMGRGLGLAAVLGIVRQHQGVVQVHSEPGRGSTFRVLLPAGEEVANQTAGGESWRDLRGSGTLLVVDDDEVIRSFSRAALEKHGYRVLLARDVPEAVRLFQERPLEIGLVLIDLAMPGMEGPQTLDRILASRPDTPLVLSGGLQDQRAERRLSGKRIAGFLPKPYTARQLAERIKECMPSGTGLV
jgi:two-component system CheB/CheR fusion protein